MTERLSPHMHPTIKVLVADRNPYRAKALSAILRADLSLEVQSVPVGGVLIDVVHRYQPDVVLVDMARADRDALDSIRALSDLALESPIALFVDKDDGELMEAAFDSGVCSYNVLDAPPDDVKPLLRAAIALYVRFQQTRAALDAAEQKIEERQIIDKAKKLFMRNEKTNEIQAYHWFRKRAMQTSQRIVQVAMHYIAIQQESDAP